MSLPNKGGRWEGLLYQGRITKILVVKVLRDNQDKSKTKVKAKLNGLEKLRRCNMKRLTPILILVVVIGSLLATGCTGGPKVYTDPDKVINVKVGQEFIIALGANPTTGYTWNEGFDGDFLQLIENKYKPSDTKGGMVGAGGVRSFQFKALKKGETKVTLVHKQAWEGGNVGETEVFRVSIS